MSHYKIYNYILLLVLPEHNFQKISWFNKVIMSSMCLEWNVCIITLYPDYTYISLTLPPRLLIHEFNKLSFTIFRHFLYQRTWTFNLLAFIDHVSYLLWRSFWSVIFILMSLIHYSTDLLPPLVLHRTLQSIIKPSLELDSSP